MTTYRVVRHAEPKVLPPQVSAWDIDQARQLQQKYGLAAWTINEIILVWRNYSDSVMAGWLDDSKESIEEAFGVILEEVDVGEQDPSVG